MELLGQIGKRKIYYCNVRSDKSWYDHVVFQDWIAFTIADNEDKELLNDLTVRCLDKGVCYTCSAGQLGSLTEDYFDEEIVSREVKRSEQTGIAQDYEMAPSTSFHNNFDEGFWFAAVTAHQIINDVYIETTEVICIDCTRDGVQEHLVNLIDKINNDWLPSDNENTETSSQ